MRTKPARPKSKPNAKLSQEVLRWLRPELRDEVTLQSLPDGTLTAIPLNLISLVEALQNKKIPILTSGIPLAEVKGRDCLPLPALALSVGLDEEAFPRVELPQEEAIRYLAREAVTLSPDTPRGLVLVTYAGYPLALQSTWATEQIIFILRRGVFATPNSYCLPFRRRDK